MRRLSLMAAIGIAACGIHPAQAQKLEWRQTFNMPKGENMPPGTTADILGIEMGDGYDAVRKVVIALDSHGGKPPEDKRSAMQRSIAEMNGEDQRPPLTESTVRLSLPVSPPIQVSYVGELRLKKETKGAGTRTIDETIRVNFSSPASGHQALSAYRSISYRDAGDQPRIGEILRALKAKYKMEPFAEKYERSAHYTFAWSKGSAIAGQRKPNCFGGFANGNFNQSALPGINPNRECDVSLSVEFRFGVSPDHAETVIFNLMDAERSKRDYGADFDFLNDYVKKVRSGGAAPPKL
jgi:hypothetical protein